MYTKIAYQTWSFRIKTHQQKAKKSRVSSVAEPSCSVSDQNPEAHKLICGVRVGGTDRYYINQWVVTSYDNVYIRRKNQYYFATIYFYEWLHIKQRKKTPQLSGKMRFCCHPFTSYVVYIGKIFCWFLFNWGLR